MYLGFLLLIYRYSEVLLDEEGKQPMLLPFILYQLIYNRIIHLIGYLGLAGGKERKDGRRSSSA